MKYQKDLDRDGRAYWTCDGCMKKMNIEDTPRSVESIYQRSVIHEVCRKCYNNIYNEVD